MGKGENAGNQHFLLFPLCLLLYERGISVFLSHLDCRLQNLSIRTSLKVNTSSLLNSEILDIYMYDADSKDNFADKKLDTQIIDFVIQKDKAWLEKEIKHWLPAFLAHLLKGSF